MKKSILCIASFFCFLASDAQIVTIPDPTFKTLLLQNPSINLNSDTEIQLSEANNFAGVLNVTNGFTIADMTGLEEFTQITELHCAVNALTQLDVSNNSLVTVISCYGNSINSLIIGTNSNLTELAVSANSLQALDMSAYSNLTALNCSGNPLTELNVANGNNTNMTLSAMSTNLQCIQVDDPNYSDANWFGIDFGVVFSLNCSGTTSLGELSTDTKELVAITDLLGRETEFKRNTIQIYLYNDGTTEKVYRTE